MKIKVFVVLLALSFLFGQQKIETGFLPVLLEVDTSEYIELY